MAYTRHGHHIKGTDTENPPGTQARCGGPGICGDCSSDAATFLGENKTSTEPKFVWVVRENTDKTEGRGPLVDVAICASEQAAYEENRNVGGAMGHPRHFAGDIYKVELGGYPLVETKVWGYRKRSWDGIFDFGWLDERDKPNPTDPEYAKYLELKKKFEPNRTER